MTGTWRWVCKVANQGFRSMVTVSDAWEALYEERDLGTFASILGSTSVGEFMGKISLSPALCLSNQEAMKVEEKTASMS